MKKICTNCGLERDAEKDFSWKYKDRGIRNTRCKVCQSQVSKQHYQGNKQSYMARVHARNDTVIIDNRRRLTAYFADHPCVDCGLTDIRVLEFDHVRDEKVGNIAALLTRGVPWSTIAAEIAKCDVRCANCHRIQTIERGQWWRFDLME
jgi:hypothetical protein